MKMNIHILSLVFFVAFTANLLSTVAADFTGETCGGMCMKVFSRSGKILFRRCCNNKDFAKAFTVEMDVIKRADGKEIDDLVPKYQDFTIGELKPAVLQNVKAMKLSATAYFEAQKAHLHIDVYTLCQNGAIKFDDDEIVLRTGSMKLFLRLENYTPNDPRPIDLGLIVRGRKGQYPSDSEELEGDHDRPELNRNIPCWTRKKCGKHFRFGDGDGTDDEMSFATKCKVDGKFVYFESDDYPKLEQIGKRYRIGFLVPANLSKSIEIDPGLTLGDEFYYEDGEGYKCDIDDKGGNAVSLQLNLLLLFVMLAAIFALH